MHWISSSDTSLCSCHHLSSRLDSRRNVLRAWNSWEAREIEINKWFFFLKNYHFFCLVSFESHFFSKSHSKEAQTLRPSRRYLNRYMVSQQQSTAATQHRDISRGSFFLPTSTFHGTSTYTRVIEFQIFFIYIFSSFFVVACWLVFFCWLVVYNDEYMKAWILNDFIYSAEWDFTFWVSRVTKL